jgi:acyl carrier protein
VHFAPNSSQNVAGDPIVGAIEKLVDGAERRFGLERADIAPHLAFLTSGYVSPEAGYPITLDALEAIFGESAGEIIVSSVVALASSLATTGYEELIAIKILESGEVPPAPDGWFENPNLNHFYLSKGGRYTPMYILQEIGGSATQLAMLLFRRIPGDFSRLDNRELYSQWLGEITGYEKAEAEIENGFLRVEDKGVPQNLPRSGAWTYGLGPIIRAPVGDWAPGADLSTPETGVSTARPAGGEEVVRQPVPTEITDEAVDEASPASGTGELVDAQEALSAGKDAVPLSQVSVRDGITVQVMMIAAEHTGVSIDKLDLDLDLVNQLGMSEKEHAELMIDICQNMGVRGYVNLDMGEYPSIAHMIAFARERRPDLVEEEIRPLVEDDTIPADIYRERIEIAADPLVASVLQFVSDETGYPVDMLAQSLDLEFELDPPQPESMGEFPTLTHVIKYLQNSDVVVTGAETADQDLSSEMPVADIETAEVDDPDMGSENDSAKDMALWQAAVAKSYGDQSSTGEGMDGDDSPDSAELQNASAEKAPPIVFAIAETVMLIAAERTGNQPEELAPEMELSSDLSLDQESRAEVVSAVLESFGIPQPAQFQPDDYKTLGDLIAFVREKRPDLVDLTLFAPESEDQNVDEKVDLGKSTVESKEPAVEETQVSRVISTRVRRIPTPVMQPSLAECPSTGIELNEKRIVVMYDRGGVAKALVTRLRELGAMALPLLATARGDELENRLIAWLDEGPIDGVYWLAALDYEPPLNHITLDTWRELNRQRVKNLYTTMRTLYQSVSQPGTFLISATRTGGFHGYGEAKVTAPMGGSVCGFLKAFQREQGMVLVKAIDFELDEQQAVVAEAIIAETERDPDHLEVGYRGGNRYGFDLAEGDTTGDDPGLALDQNSVFLVSGAADRRTNDIINGLAKTRGTFYMLDLVAVPDAEDPRVALFRSDKRALREQLIEEIRTAVPEPTAAMVEKIMAAIEREEAVLKAIEAVNEGGGEAHYYCVDLLDQSAVSTVLEEIRQNQGRIDLLLHTTGLEISRTLPEKDPIQFNLVYDAKVDGFFNLLKASEDMPVGAAVLFRAVETRYGNLGQTDSTAADELLRKLTASLNWQRPGTRGLAITVIDGWEASASSDKSVGDIPTPADTVSSLVRDELTGGHHQGEVVFGWETRVEPPEQVAGDL